MNLPDDIVRALAEKARIEALDAPKDSDERITWMNYAEAADDLLRQRMRNDGKTDIGVRIEARDNASEALKDVERRMGRKR